MSITTNDPLPPEDSVQNDARSGAALELALVPSMRDLGGFQVRRALPHRRRQMIGPFIFFDQMGPAQFTVGRGVDVRPHPHIGLATVTYLFAGSILHRDTEGNVLEIAPGAHESDDCGPWHRAFRAHPRRRARGGREAVRDSELDSLAAR